MIKFDEFINIPYKHRGRDFDGVDCFGLLYLIFKTKRDIILPNFLDLQYNKSWYKEGCNYILENKDTVPGTFWIEIKKPYKLYDGLIFFLGNKKVANHIGMYLYDGQFIHVYEDSKVEISRLDDLYWDSRFYGAVRYIK